MLKVPDLTSSLLQTLPRSSNNLFNPWKDCCVHDVGQDASKQRVRRLRQHLACNAKIILVGEAPGYQGCRYTGVPFTSERLLLEGRIPRIPAPNVRLTDRPRKFSEPSATIVWRVLTELGIQNETILWNAVQLHPHRPGIPWSNRPPTRDETALGAPALHILSDAFPQAIFIPIGRKAQALLAETGIAAAPYIRHPANGGAREFTQGLRAVC